MNRHSVRPGSTSRRLRRERCTEADFLKAFNLGIEIGQTGAAKDPAAEYERGYRDGGRDAARILRGEL